MNEKIQFASDPATAPIDPTAPWVLLVVDDDPEVHAVTRLMLGATRIDNRDVSLLHANSAAEARPVLAQRTDIALVLLDVVMETEHAGLDLARYIREELRNDSVRIVLRTGQPGQAPAHEVVTQYNIDDYVSKAELTFQRLQILVTTGLRTYQQIRHLERIAHVDPLTGLQNRRHVEQQVCAAWEEFAKVREPLVALMIDVDHFKDYNDAHGHPAGDHVLLEVGRVLSTHSGANSWLCRYGGEEFLSVMRGATLQQGVLTAERLRQTVASLRLPHKQSLYGVVTISIGVATIEPRLHPLDTGYPQLIKDADRALYRAKRGGRNRVESGLPGVD